MLLKEDKEIKQRVARVKREIKAKQAKAYKRFIKKQEKARLQRQKEAAKHEKIIKIKIR